MQNLQTFDKDYSLKNYDCQNLLENNKNMLNVTNTDSTRESFPSETRIHITPTRTKKRVKHVSEWANAKRKLLRTQGKEYVSNGKIHQAKTLKVYNHVCRYKCNENIPETKRRELFKEFYKLSSYDHQTAFLSSCVKKMEIKRKKGIIHNKNYSTCITLLNTRVCKEFFLKTFDISNKRFTFVCKKTNHLGMAQPDKRGKGKNHRKMNEENRTFVITHIKMFPRYKSHYSRKSNSETKYLSSNLNIKKIKVQLAIHQSKAERAINAKKHDIVANSNNPDTVVVCFDLQQTLPTPLLTTSKVFYLRQLWTYNFCVYNLVTGKAHMYVWSEDVASRGSQEIGSCLLDFIKSLPAHVKKLIAYSDSCGGQNKNKNICKLFMFLVKSTPLEEIHHKFLEPGHTYMECDRAFGLIEKRKKLIPQVFSYLQYFLYFSIQIFF
ncbi:hypothetical protein RI129_002959 [Pyrocoelia pectoralis]|uniref:DUF7869 domain-containing protein n=1 Tax=Pyrocoelia pectoralis TaxID=417401 RepID=A0AAN7ZMN4_9COLE